MHEQEVGVGSGEVSVARGGLLGLEGGSEGEREGGVRKCPNPLTLGPRGGGREGGRACLLHGLLGGVGIVVLHLDVHKTGEREGGREGGREDLLSR